MASVADILTTLEYGPAPESASPVEEWLERHGRNFGLFFGGKWVKAKTEESFETFAPANGRVIARVAQAGDKDVDAAVKAARKALPEWQALAPHARARYLYALARG